MRAAGAIAGLLVLLVPSTALASEESVAPGAKVAPGVYLAEASEVTDRDASPPATSAESFRRDPRIVGGSPTNISAWPWQTAITFDPSDDSRSPFSRQFCGGSLVAPAIIVSAAHCFYDDDAGAFTNPDLYAAITGATNLSTTPGPSPEGQEIDFVDYHFFVDASGNPRYNPNTNEWDAVFIELAGASTSSPITVAGADEASLWAPADENAWATGWGTTTFGGLKSTQLREVNIDILADSVCGASTSYGSGYKPETMVCAGEVLGGQDTCQGDSGGPLVVPVGGGAFRLVGDTSFGLGCAFPNFPGVYGRVAQDPMCTALRNGIQTEAGVDVVGPGGCRPVSDTGPPDTLITKGPKNKTKKKKARFEFTSTEAGSSFDCTVDGRAPKAPCTSPIRVKVKKGRHTFQVRATDPAGNADPTPASDSWKRKKKKRKK
jgi:hypothetical protein